MKSATRFLAVIAAAMISIQTAHAAIVIPSTNLDDLISSGEIGTQIAGPLTDDFLTPPGQAGPNDIGDIINTVFLNDSDPFGPIYTYVHEVIPGVSNVSEFNTGFDLRDHGFNLIAGYSFSDVAAIGGTGTALDFTIIFSDDTDGTLDWETTLPLGEFYDAGESVRFFFQSTLAPSLASVDYNIINSEVGTAQSFGPSAAQVIPAPQAFVMGLIGMTGLVATRWRRYRMNRVA